ncbi:DNRLRE domain-containing protein [Arthrobacter sp. AB6]|uniref:CBM96 family carbohydrate-binding protein n=1 Tax=Arthrobacter sp. AB6 TaxID=2962570 RepID=UPI0028814C5C|nr:DNRLRE domain-containing protein [Arthrobacter sp. AB6]MDT0193836.1 DNRLRE domain-containing protein [Arthrobacter sp. AB6]
MITESRTFVASLLAAVTVGAFVLLGSGASGDPRAVAALSTDGTTAAEAHNWGSVVTGDEFNYVGAPDPLKWNVYNSAGHAGNGLRSPAQVTVDGTKMVMNGTPNGTTAGMGAKFANQKYGRWEVRAAGSGDNEYHMVSILWPDSENWPCDGEIDYAETTGDWNVIQFFHHYSCSNLQTFASKALDVSQFHNYAVDWSPAGITGYVDGVQWFQDNTASHQPPGSMHQTLQLDWFPDSTPDGAGEMRVDWVRVYAAAGTVVSPPPPSGDSWEFAAVGDMNPEGNTSTSSASGQNAASITASLNDGSLDNFIGIGDFQYNQGTCSALVAWDTLWGGVKAKTFWTAGPGHDVDPGVNDDVDRFMNGECVSTTKSATNTTLGRFQDALEWYSFDKGNWHIVAAPTATWLYNPTRAQAMTAEMDADMKAAKAAGKHLAVVYHDPYFTSDTSIHTRFTQAKPWIDMFWANRVKLLLSGSQHNYERTCPVDNADQCVTDGMQQFQVSTGGIDLRPFLSDPAYVQKKFSDTWGHLRMSLKADGSYSWEFRPVHGGMQTDSGSREPGTAPPGDTTAPETTITSGPPASSTSTSASFAFTSSEANSTFQCSLDGGPRVACTSPQTYAGLSIGSHTFDVWATDAAGNTDATAATHSWSVVSGGGASETVTLTAIADSYVTNGTGLLDTNFGTSTILGVDNSPAEVTYLKFDLSAYAGRTLESATLQLRSAGNGSTGSQNVKLVGNDSWSETGITYSNKPPLGTTIGTLVGPTTTNTNYSVSLNAAAVNGELGQQLSLGMDTSSNDGLDLNSRDAGSTAAPKLVLTLGGGGGGGGDTTAPETTITSGPPASSTSTSASFTFTSSEANSTFQCSLDGGPRVACTSPQTYAGLSIGSHTFDVWATDAAGNTDATAATHSWSVVSGGGASETVTLTAAADSYVTNGTGLLDTNFGTSTILGVDNSPAEVTYLKFDLSAYAGRTLESATLQLRSAGNGSTGSQNVKLVGNDSWSETGITYSNKPPLGTTIGTLVGPTTTNTNYSVSLNAAAVNGELGQQLSLGMDTSSNDGLDLNSRDAGSTAAPKLVLTLGGGGGGGGDTTAPETTITSGPPASSTSTSASFTFTSSEANSTFQCSLDGGPRVACTSPQTYAGLSIGSHTFDVWATDAAGNTDATAATHSWSVVSGGGASETVTLTAIADSYVSSRTATTNFGTSTILGVDNSPVEVTYLKFDLSAYAGRTLESATLQLRSARSGSKGTQNVKLVGIDDWSETGITYNNKPPLGTTIGTLVGPTTTNTNYSVSLNPAAVNGELGQLLSLGMDTSSSDGLDLNSREAGSTAAPKLVLTLK